MMLEDLGPRICIIGPSNSGKSTLAEAISRSRSLPAIHLDQLHHQPHTDWIARPAEEFAALHDTAIQTTRWVMDGNYSRLFSARFGRASGLIVLDIPTGTSLLRYVRRCWFEKERRGGLVGARDRVTWGMIHHIAFVARANRRRYRQIYDATALPKLMLAGQDALDAFYRLNGLTR